MTQLALFERPEAEQVRNPLCIYIPHCGHQATLGPRVDWPGGYNRTICCDHCGATGEESTRT